MPPRPTPARPTRASSLRDRGVRELWTGANRSRGRRPRRVSRSARRCCPTSEHGDRAARVAAATTRPSPRPRTDRPPVGERATRPGRPLAQPVPRGRPGRDAGCRGVRAGRSTGCGAAAGYCCGRRGRMRHRAHPEPTPTQVPLGSPVPAQPLTPVSRRRRPREPAAGIGGCGCAGGVQAAAPRHPGRPSPGRPGSGRPSSGRPGRPVGDRSRLRCSFPSAAAHRPRCRCPGVPRAGVPGAGRGR